MSEPIAVGSQAPDFTLQASDNSTVTLSDLRGQKVILAFYPAAFSPGCQNQMDAFTAGNDEITALGARVFGISVDSWWSHKAWKAAALSSKVKPASGARRMSIRPAPRSKGSAAWSPAAG